MLYDSQGRLLESSLNPADPGLANGWVPSVGILSPNSASVGSYASFQLSRPYQRRAARIAYLSNPMLYGALEVIHGFVLGTGVTVGDIADKRASEAVSDFWLENNMPTLLNRMFTEYMLDGESLAVWPRGQADKNKPAHIALVDVDRGLSMMLDPLDSTIVTGVDVADGYGNEMRFGQGEFRFHAHDALWNDPRGWPPVMRAVPACLAYIGFLERRMRLHDIQSRINGVYKAFATTKAEQQAKAAGFQAVPGDGQILTIAKHPQSGQSEEFDFVTQRLAAADAVADGRLIRLIVAVALNLPEHFIGEAGDANLATASAMSYPARKGFERKQRWVENWLDDVMATELERRYGPGQTYSVKTSKVSADGLTRVNSTKKLTARQLKLPFSFPSLDDENMANLLQKVQVASAMGLASKVTLAGELGYDSVSEADLLAAQHNAEAAQQAQNPPQIPDANVQGRNQHQPGTKLPMGQNAPQDGGNG